MRDVAAIIARAEESIGNLVANHHEYEALYEALRSGEHAYEMVPSVLPRMIRQGSWSDRYEPHRHQRIQVERFRDFIERQPPEGLGTTEKTIRQYLAGHPDKLEEFNLMLAIPRGGSNNPTGKNQHAEVNRSIRTVDLGIEASGLDPVAVDVAHESAIGTRGTARKGPSRGTTVEYAVRRLTRKRPDLMARVRAGELSFHAAMREAGFRRPVFQVPEDPAAAARALARHFTRQQFDDLVAAALAEYERKGERP